MQYISLAKHAVKVVAHAHTLIMHSCMVYIVYMHRLCKIFLITPSNNKEYPPFLEYSVEDKHQHQIEHDSLTQHPKEHSSEQVVKKSSHKHTRSLQVMENYRINTV